MKLPFFSLAGRGTREVEYRGQSGDGAARFYAYQDKPELSLPTLQDAGVMVWAASKLAEAKNSGRELPSILEFQPSEILTLLGRDTGGHQHALLEAALRRLAGTVAGIDRTNNPGEIINLLEHYERPRRGRAKKWSMRLSGWFTSQVARRNIVKVDPRSLQLKGLERCLYRWARAHAGSPRWFGGRAKYEEYRISLAYAHRKAGSTDTARKFALRVRELVREQSIPGFELVIEIADGAEVLMIRRPAGRSFADMEEIDMRGLFGP